MCTWTTRTYFNDNLRPAASPEAEHLSKSIMFVIFCNCSWMRQLLTTEKNTRTFLSLLNLYMLNYSALRAPRDSKTAESGREGISTSKYIMQGYSVITLKPSGTTSSPPFCAWSRRARKCCRSCTGFPSGRWDKWSSPSLSSGWTRCVWSCNQLQVMNVD